MSNYKKKYLIKYFKKCITSTITQLPHVFLYSVHANTCTKSAIWTHFGCRRKKKITCNLTPFLLKHVITFWRHFEEYRVCDVSISSNSSLFIPHHPVCHSLLSFQLNSTKFLKNCWRIVEHIYQMRIGIFWRRRLFVAVFSSLGQTCTSDMLVHVFFLTR